MNAVALALIDETRRMAKVIIAVVISRSRRDKSIPRFAVLSPTARNVSLHIVIVERDLIG